MPVDETRESILKKQEELRGFLKDYPKFRGGLMQLATTYLQLGRTGEAREILQKYHEIDQTDPTAEYYLSIVSAERHDFNKSWEYLKQAEVLTEQRDHKPTALRSLRNKLRTLCPES